MHDAYIAVGSNLGNPREQCEAAISTLGKRCGALRKASSFYRTEPVGYGPQNWFVNAVAEIQTSLGPLSLLSCLQEIQKRMGRARNGIRFGPRLIDLDILLYDDLVLHTPHLEIPHPRMHKRRFVLVPICDINPQIFHPVLKRTMRELLDLLPEKGQAVHPVGFP